MRKTLFLLVIISLFIVCSIFSPKKSADCVIVGNITVTEDFEGDIHFLGEIKNQGDGKALFVKINFTMKNASGDVIGTDFTYVNSTDLNPSQTSSFECYTTVARSDVADWSSEIDWQEED